MTTHDALLRAVLERPADDLPRLVLADWLDENGQPERAEFIRIQVGLAQTTKRHVITEPVSLTKHGPGYWECSGGARTANGLLVMVANPGDRVDILGRKNPLFGLRLVKYRDDPGERDGRGGAILALDEHSGPWAGAELAKREWELLNAPSLGGHGAANWCVWGKVALDALPPSRSGVYSVNPKDQPFHFTRGFVSSIRLPLAAFTEAVARELFTREPVTSVSITDRSPGEYEDYQAVWSREMNGPELETLPDAIFDLLQGGECIDYALVQCKSMTESFGLTHKAVQAAIDACVAYGRSFAGLPPLPTSGNSSTSPLTA